VVPSRVPRPRPATDRPDAEPPAGAGTPGEPDATRDPALFRLVRLVGELVVTVALVMTLFVVYQLYVVPWSAAKDQRRTEEQLQRAWERAPAAPAPSAPTPDVSIGDPFAVLRIPALGSDWRFTVVEGTGQEELARGLGHYVGTDFPGQPGNVGIAGHRVGRGTPFDRLHELKSCDAVVVETQEAWFVYRVLPMAEERTNWARSSTRAGCDGVGPLPGDYADTVGREIVTPDRTDVLAAVPHRPDLGLPSTAPAHLLTLTTCHPRFSARQRMIVHAVQVGWYDKRGFSPDFRPPELLES
jgi:sortase (surface protein transpeptidase)